MDTYLSIPSLSLQWFFKFDLSGLHSYSERFEPKERVAKTDIKLDSAYPAWQWPKAFIFMQEFYRKLFAEIGLRPNVANIAQ